MKDTEIVLNTFGSLLKHGYGINVGCLNCGRNVELDLTALPPNASCIDRWYRCKCGHRNRGHLCIKDNPFKDGIY